VIAGEGAPMPLCPPPGHCNDQYNLRADQNNLRVIAGEGAPMPLCPPPGHCNDQNNLRADQNNLRVIAGEGAPMPLCPPPGHCNDQASPMPTTELASLQWIVRNHVERFDAYYFSAIRSTTEMEIDG